jgi:hypothetical protein
MKYLKLYENFEETFVGYHCNDSESTLKEDDFIGNIKEEYYERFEDILIMISRSYPEVSNFIDRIRGGEEEFYYETDLAWEIEQWFEDNNIEWIFVSEHKPLNRYGNNCYEVYFKSDKNIYSMEDSAEENSVLYVYNNLNRPILKKYRII